MITALLAVAALHAGFQAVVTVVVYPALVEVPADRWARAHDAHSRRISVLVVPLYVAVLAVCGAVLVEGDLHGVVWLALGGQGAALLATAALAAPTHGSLGRRGPEPALLARLLLADRLRCAAALVGLLGAVLASAS